MTHDTVSGLTSTDPDDQTLGDEEQSVLLIEHVFETEQFTVRNLASQRIIRDIPGKIKTAQACLTPTGRLMILASATDEGGLHESYRVHCINHGQSISPGWIEAQGIILLEGDIRACLIFLEDLEDDPDESA